MTWPDRRPEVATGERVLAHARTRTGTVLAGTRAALFLPGPDGGAIRVPWECVQSADWDDETATLRVSEMGTWGEQRPSHSFVLLRPDRLLQLLRERVSASILWQQSVPIRGRQGVRVIARRSLGSAERIEWFYDFDPGIDPSDPDVRRLADAALHAAQHQLGLAP